MPQLRRIGSSATIGVRPSLASMAASKIPGFGKLDTIWGASSPLPWDTVADKQEVANAVAFLLGPLSRKITGQILTVDGGAGIVAGELQPFELAPERQKR